jgi:hypothetical protein
VLAHDPPAKPAGPSVPPVLLVAGLVVGIGVGYGALRLIQALR